MKNPEARRGGLDVSLFRLLSDRHPQAVVDLSFQYRMNEDIMSLSNRLIYGNRLKCGSEEVAKQELVLPVDLTEVFLGTVGVGSSGWLEDLMNPK